MKAKHVAITRLPLFDIKEQPELEDALVEDQNHPGADRWATATPQTPHRLQAPRRFLSPVQVCNNASCHQHAHAEQLEIPLELTEEL